MDGKNKLVVIVRFFFITTSHTRPGPKNGGGREAMTGNASAVRRLGWAKLA